MKNEIEEFEKLATAFEQEANKYYAEAESYNDYDRKDALIGIGNAVMRCAKKVLQTCINVKLKQPV